VHPERPQQARQQVGAGERFTVEVDVQLPVGELPGDPVRHVHRERGLADPRFTVDHRHRHVPRAGPAQPRHHGHLAVTAGEVRHGTRQLAARGTV
jgi:hypothetical protein